MACCKFQKHTGEIGFRHILFCIVINGLERGCKPIMAIIAADEGKQDGVRDTSEEETQFRATQRDQKYGQEMNK